MLIIGSHVSFGKDKQLLGSVEEALSYGSNTFMFYTGAPQNTVRYPLSDTLKKEALEKMTEAGIDFHNVVVHAPYIINLANPDPSKYDFSVRFLEEEIKRCDFLGISRMVLHSGSHVGVSLDIGIKSIIQGLNQLLSTDSKVMILLETMAGKGNEVGRTLEEVKQIIDGVQNKERIGVCIDTCHLNDAGYDLSDFDAFLNLFDQIIGLSYIQCVHVNDSKNERGSHKDRHENIGFGTIGFDTLQSIIYHPALEKVPKILETPYVDRLFPPYKEEIQMIRNRNFDPDLIEKIRITKTDE